MLIKIFETLVVITNYKLYVYVMDKQPLEQTVTAEGRNDFIIKNNSSVENLPRCRAIASKV
jgi:hypothetical protein